MRCPSLSELPHPPLGKTGWLWTEDSPRLPDTMPDGSPWPRISIVTPSYNQGVFLEETIRSVLLQGYPNLEYMIIDGGSTDNSVEIIKKYSPWLTWWVSEKDKGQSHAINKGFARSTGEIMAWLNSDDTYLAGCLARVASEIPHQGGILVGAAIEAFISTGEEQIVFKKPSYEQMLFEGRVVPQASTFWHKTLWEKAGCLDENIHYLMDYALWLRMFPIADEIRFIEIPFSLLHMHDGQKIQERNATEILLERIYLISSGKTGISPWRYFEHNFRNSINNRDGWRKLIPKSTDLAVLVYKYSSKAARFMISRYPNN